MPEFKLHKGHADLFPSLPLAPGHEDPETSRQTIIDAARVIADSAKDGYCITKAQLEIIAKADRFFPLLIRCGTCRMVASAQDVPQIISLITSSGDYVRDVSIMTHDPRTKEAWERLKNQAIQFGTERRQ